MIWCEVDLQVSVEDRRGFPQRIGFERVPVAGERVFFSPTDKGEDWPDAINEGLYEVAQVFWEAPAPGHVAEPRIAVKALS